MAFGIILLPRQQDADLLHRMSLDLSKGIDCWMILGPASPPHISVLHVEGDQEECWSWWEAIRQELATSDHIATLRGLSTASIPVGDFYVPNGGGYVGLEVTRSAELLRAHSIALIRCHEWQLTPLGVTGDGYQPHITLCVTKSGALPSTRPPVQNLRLQSLRLAFGKLGAFGTFPAILDVSPIVYTDGSP